MAPAALLVLACQRRSPDDGDRAACAAACRSLVAAGCRSGSGEELADEKSCVTRCVEERRSFGQAVCVTERRRYLACVAERTKQCPGDCSPAVCLREGVAPCAALHAEYRRCIAPCEHAGATHVGERTSNLGKTSYELVRAGCGECQVASKGAPEGAACRVASICQEHCCACEGGPGRYRARVCDQGACASREQACRLTSTAEACAPADAEPE